MKVKTLTIINILLLLLIGNSHMCCAQTNMCIPNNLKCDNWSNPFGIDELNPQLSWNIKAPLRLHGIHQSAFQILVSGSIALLQKDEGQFWNSGKITSNHMLQIPYDGIPLTTNQECWWKVRFWNEKGHISKWSRPARWTMGVLNQKQWTAQWITAKGAEKYAPLIQPSKTDFIYHRLHPDTWLNKLPLVSDLNFSSMLLRKDFAVRGKILRCLVNICGLGEYELTINGRKVGNHLLAPGLSSFDKTVLYDTYDVTPLLRNGSNAIGIILSNGLYNVQPDSIRYVKMLNSYGPLKAIAQLRLEYSEGSIKIFGTDTSWKVNPGPVTFMNYYGGEDYDARIVPQGWNLPVFKQGNQWENAILTTDSATLKGLSAAAPPVTAIEELKPIKIRKISASVWIYDLGQNASIMPKISIKGTTGSSIRIIPAELLRKDGTVDRTSVTQDGVRPAWWQYTLGTDGTAHWFPQFFYQGARYLQVELFAAPGETLLPNVKSIVGVVVHSSAQAVGNFSCSNKLFNKIYNLVRWAQRSNMTTVLTDCPHREKMPWLEEYHLNGPSIRYNYDLTNLFAKSMNDMADAQLDNGLIPNIAPEYFHAGSDWQNNSFRNSPEWGSAFIIVPWQQYLFSGDTSLMARYYVKMKRYLKFLDASSKDHLLYTGLGDWYDIGPKPAWGSQLTPESFTASAIYFYDYDIIGKMAKILNKTDDTTQFAKEKEAIRTAFNSKFYNRQKVVYATGSNTSYAMPVFFNIEDINQRANLMQNLVDSIRIRNNSFTSGEVGYRFLLRSLADNGFSNVIYDMNNQTDRPGYGYEIKQGATSLTEKWDAAVGNFGSQDHFMSGQINEWFFHNLAGIGNDETGPGFSKIIIKPAIVGNLTWVKGSYQSTSGLIAVSWKRHRHILSLNVSIPTNCTALVYLPFYKYKDFMVDGKSSNLTKNVHLLKYENGNGVLQIGSGNYHFTSQVSNL